MNQSNGFFCFFKFIFDINTLKQFKNIKIKFKTRKYLKFQKKTSVIATPSITLIDSV
jgi:hypothetical protein